MILRRVLPLAMLLLIAASCRTTPLDNVWPGCRVCTPVAEPAPRIPTACRIEERVSPRVDCNPVKTQHTLVVTVLDQCGQPMPGQRVEWMLSRYPEAVGDIVAVDDQYGTGRIAPMAAAYPGNNGNKIDNQYAVSVTNWGPELLDAGNNHPYEDENGVRLPDITVGPGETWLTITSTREGVTDIVIYVPGIRDGTKHKCWAKKIWADFNVDFPESAVNIAARCHAQLPRRPSCARTAPASPASPSRPRSSMVRPSRSSKGVRTFQTLETECQRRIADFNACATARRPERHRTASA